MKVVLLFKFLTSSNIALTINIKQNLRIWLPTEYSIVDIANFKL